MWFWLKLILKETVNRINYWLELSKWEKKKRKEGFPKEWFRE